MQFSNYDFIDSKSFAGKIILTSFPGLNPSGLFEEKILAKELEISFVKLLKFYDDVYLAEWIDNLVKTRESYINVNGLKPKFADYECFLTLKENLSDKKLLNFYTLIKNTKRKKIFV